MGDMPAVDLKIKLDDKAVQGFFDMLDKNHLELDDAITVLSETIDRQEKKKNNKLEEIFTTPDCDSYKFRVEDGWLWIERGFYRSMVEYVENKNEPDLFEYFESLERNYAGRFRIVNQEERATVVSGKMAQLLRKVDELIVLDNYESYYLVYDNDSKKEIELYK